MYLVYLDESGDPGLIPASPTSFFVLSAIVIHERDWLNVLDSFISFRQGLKIRYGLLMNEEIHAGEFVSGRPSFRNAITKFNRLLILKECLTWLSSQPNISVISVRIDKNGYPNASAIFEYTWRVLLQRVENTLTNRNFPSGFGVSDEKGIILSDNTHGIKVTKLLRGMRRFNPIPHMAGVAVGSRLISIRSIIEDPVYRDSAYSYFHQLADVVAFFARQHYEPNRYIRKKSARNWYSILQPVINTHVVKAATWSKIVEK